MRCHNSCSTIAQADRPGLYPETSNELLENFAGATKEVDPGGTDMPRRDGASAARPSAPKGPHQSTHSPDAVGFEHPGGAGSSTVRWRLLAQANDAGL